MGGRGVCTGYTMGSSVLIAEIAGDVDATEEHVANGCFVVSSLYLLLIHACLTSKYIKTYFLPTTNNVFPSLKKHTYSLETHPAPTNFS